MPTKHERDASEIASGSIISLEEGIVTLYAICSVTDDQSMKTSSLFLRIGGQHFFTHLWERSLALSESKVPRRTQVAMGGDTNASPVLSLIQPCLGGAIRYQTTSASVAAWRGFILLFLEARIVGRDALRR